MRAFVSYSHRDAWALDRLKTHLAVLQREGLISVWSDREIPPGNEIDSDIVEQLNTCEIFLPLASPDFLASFYCYERELAGAIARQEAGTLRIVPIVIEPCDWTSSPLRRFKALPEDGKPIVEWTNQNNAFLDVTRGLRKVCTGAIEATTGAASSYPREVDERAGARSERRYRLKKDFDEIDKSDYRSAAFAEIRDYFAASSVEMNQIDGLRARCTPMNESAFTCTVVNKGHSDGTSHITVGLRSSAHGLGDIVFAYQPNAALSSTNGSFDVSQDEYELFLTGGAFSGWDRDKRLSPRQAAEALWSSFIKMAGIVDD